MTPHTAYTAYTAYTALRLVEVLASAGVLLGSLERLARPRALDDASLASWPVLRLRRPGYATGVTGAVLTPLVAYPAVLGLHGLRAAAAAGCLWPTAGPVHAALLGLVVVTGAVLTLRGGQGGEGADQLLRIVFCALLLAAVHPTATTARLVLWFLALQVCLAYFVSGLYKVTSRTWLDGSALTGILTTRAYGHPAVAARLLAHPAATRWLSRAVSLAETLFPLVLLAPPAWLPLFLAAGLAFHVACAALMGLNCFVWAFASAYPAVAYVVLTT
ncbi:hypothetical protein GCM10010218_47230 [Streptomyces mashuensis]|uniref:HTTM domain-containing protein n=1 Tax=Streptomyces mashuensis TaxID=33904 RepID=A0A919B7G9_9ACTN|nr:hypothetical protein [Streptomyces mashuensis]GHF60367.1 hypothetical protein GCM10010218_47230 [Streptomyces mashuensis]